MDEGASPQAAAVDAGSVVVASPAVATVAANLDVGACQSESIKPQMSNIHSVINLCCPFLPHRAPHCPPHHPHCRVSVLMSCSKSVNSNVFAPSQIAITILNCH